MDEAWLGKANAAVDAALASDGYNEFNSGGIGVTNPLQNNDGRKIDLPSFLLLRLGVCNISGAKRSR
jgi:hypothetical protein